MQTHEMMGWSPLAQLWADWGRAKARLARAQAQGVDEDQQMFLGIDVNVAWEKIVRATPSLKEAARERDPQEARDRLALAYESGVAGLVDEATWWLDFLEHQSH
jgi:hypothetical protein